MTSNENKSESIPIFPNKYFHRKVDYKMIVFLSSIAKFFFISFGSIYGYSRILHLKLTNKKIFIAVLFSLFSAPVINFINTRLNPLSVFTSLLCVVIFCYRLTSTPSKRFTMVFCLSMLSFGINYILFSLSLFIIAPWFYFAFPNHLETSLIKSITVLFAGIIQFLFLFLIFKIPRFRKGLPNIENNFSSEIGILISMPLVFATSLFSLKTDAEFLVLFSIFVITLLGIIIYLWWRKYLINNYIHQAQNQTIKILEDTVLKQKEELEKLSTIIHKDNKLIGALYLSVQELYNSAQPKQSSQLKTELERLSIERTGILYNYENSGDHLQKTKIFSTDVIISYLFRRALDKDIHFDVIINDDIHFMTEKILEESLLNTILADLGENAIIATSTEKQRNILISIGVRETAYYIDVFDSGAHFDALVIENLGKKRYTTHKANGGSGIGLMTTLKILETKKGSFELEEFQQNCLFRKRVSIVLDGHCKTRIYSCRKELLATCKKRGRDFELYTPTSPVHGTHFPVNQTPVS